MNARRIAASACLVQLALVAQAHAAPPRTFVASTGLDSNPCSRVAPCRNFQAAIAAVDAGGEVVALDSGTYSAMTITKSVSVIAPPGVHAGLSPKNGVPLPGFAGQSGVVLIDIADADVVVLRGLSVNHAGSVTGGIDWISSHGGKVFIEDTTVSGFPEEGIYVSANSPRLAVRNSELRGNQVGLWLEENTVARALVDRVRFEANSAAGILSHGGHLVDVSDSVFHGNAHAIQSDGTASGSTITLERCSLTESAVVFYFNVPAPIPSKIYVSNSTLSNNGRGYTEADANTNVYSRGNNTVVNTPAPGPFNSTLAPQ